MISKGFYQNIGGNKVGMAYDPGQLGESKKQLLFKFIYSPEKVFRYLVKVKPYLRSKNRSWLGVPVGLCYHYMRFNKWLKDRLFSKQLIP